MRPVARTINDSALSSNTQKTQLATDAQEKFCSYTKYLNKHRTLGYVSKTSHHRQPTRRYILDWVLATPEPGSNITLAASRNRLNIVRVTYVYARYLRVNKSQLPPVPSVGSDFYICRYKAGFLDPPPQRLRNELVNISNLPRLVLKCGRASSWTAGVVNEIDVLKFGEWDKVLHSASSVHEPTSRSVGKGIQERSFSRTMAILLGGKRTGFEDISMATPIDVIMEDIREALNLKEVQAIS